MTLVLVTAAVIAVLERPVAAYLDPGSANLALQALVGAVAAGLVVVKTYWRRIARLWRRPSNGDTPSPLP